MKYAVIDLDDEPAIVEVLMENERWALCCEVAEDGSLFDANVVPVKPSDLVVRLGTLEEAVALTARLAEISEMATEHYCNSDMADRIAALKQAMEAAEETLNGLAEQHDELEAVVLDQQASRLSSKRDEAIAAATGRRAAA